MDGDGGDVCFTYRDKRHASRDVTAINDVDELCHVAMLFFPGNARSGTRAGGSAAQYALLARYIRRATCRGAVPPPSA